MSKPNLTPIFQLMGEMGFPNFVIVAVDGQGVPAKIFRSNSPAGERVLRAYAEDWCDEQAQLAATDAFSQ